MILTLTTPTNSSKAKTLNNPKMSAFGSLNQFLDHPQPKPKLPNLELTKKQHKLKLNTSHEMIRAMVSLENEQDALKDKSNFAKSFKRMSAGIKYLTGTNKEKCLSIVAENIGLYDEKNLKEITPSIKHPEAKWATNSASMWMKKHGNEPNSGESRVFLSFLKQFFDALDESASGSLTANEVIVPLLSLGLTSDSVYIERALVFMFQSSDLKTLSFDKEAFINSFKTDKKVDVILKVLHLSCNHLLKEEEDKKIAQQAANKRASLISQVSLTEKPPSSKFPSVEDLIKLVKKWWEDLAKDAVQVNISRIGEFLSEKGIASNKHEGRAMAKSFDSSSYFSYYSFEKIFLKSVLKACLYNVADFLTTMNCEEFSMRLKLAILQRKLMIAGAKYRNDALGKKARVTLLALDKFNRKNAGNLPIINSSAIAEELNEEKITQLLFRLKENAVQFVDDCGQVKANVRNIWDIKANVPEDSGTATPKFKEEKYLMALSEPISGNLNSSPYKRQVRLFRENFLYKKFSKMVQVYPRHKSM
jgi:hypothetical protein